MAGINEVEGALLRDAGRTNINCACAAEIALVKLQLIAGFQLSRAGRPMPLPAGAQRILAFLALRNVSVDRSYAAACLWPERDEARARGNLRTALWALGKVDCLLVVSEGQSLRLAELVLVDLHDAWKVALRLVRECERASLSDCRHTGLTADLLPGWFDDWALMEQERYRCLRLHALEAASARLTQLGRYGEAVQAAAAAACAEPLRESSHRALIHAHLAAGNFQCAIRQFELFGGLLRRELGVAPSRHMYALIQSAASGRSGRLRDILSAV